MSLLYFCNFIFHSDNCFFFPYSGYGNLGGGGLGGGGPGAGGMGGGGFGGYGGGY